MRKLRLSPAARYWIPQILLTGKYTFISTCPGLCVTPFGVINVVPRKSQKDVVSVPGVTRTDQWLDERYKTLGKAIDEALKLALRPDLNDNGKLYREVMKELDILTLGVYTADADFKGFVSTTTSTVIAKYFANAYAKAPYLI